MMPFGGMEAEPSGGRRVPSYLHNKFPGGCGDGLGRFQDPTRGEALQLPRRFKRSREAPL